MNEIRAGARLRFLTGHRQQPPEGTRHDRVGRVSQGIPLRRESPTATTVLGGEGHCLMPSLQ